MLVHLTLDGAGMNQGTHVPLNRIQNAWTPAMNVIMKTVYSAERIRGVATAAMTNIAKDVKKLKKF